VSKNSAIVPAWQRDTPSRPCKQPPSFTLPCRDSLGFRRWTAVQGRRVHADTALTSTLDSGDELDSLSDDWNEEVMDEDA
jgi:hypothetical protein